MFSHSGVFASSKSASHTFAPEFSALIVIFASVGPVISTRRSTNPGAGAATCHEPTRVFEVSAKKSSVPPELISACLTTRASSSANRRARNLRSKAATNRTAAGVKISSRPTKLSSKIASCTPSDTC